MKKSTICHACEEVSIGDFSSLFEIPTPPFEVRTYFRRGKTLVDAVRMSLDSPGGKIVDPGV